MEKIVKVVGFVEDILGDTMLVKHAYDIDIEYIDENGERKERKVLDLFSKENATHEKMRKAFVDRLEEISGKKIEELKKREGVTLRGYYEKYTLINE